MKNKKQQFLNAVRILAPNDSFILQLASRFDEASLPQFPGGVALKFVVAIQSLRDYHPVTLCRAPGRGRSNSTPHRHRGKRSCSRAASGMRPSSAATGRSSAPSA